jgi:hypothetical protein
MLFVAQLFFYLAIASAVFLIIGLFKPWMMLWWEDVQNRKKVIKLYGSISICSFLLYFILLQLW